MLRTIIYILLIAICLSSCSPLRHVRRAEQVDSTAVDKSVIEVRDTIREVVNQVVTQTVIEYYPVYDTVYVEAPAVIAPAPSEVAVTPRAVPQPIKSITRTEIRTEAVSTEAKDSVILKDTASEVSRECDTETEESPPPTVISIKWIAIALIALCVIIILIRFKFLL